MKLVLVCKCQQVQFGGEAFPLSKDVFNPQSRVTSGVPCLEVLNYLKVPSSLWPLTSHTGCWTQQPHWVLGHSSTGLFVGSLPGDSEVLPGFLLRILKNGGSHL